MNTNNHECLGSVRIQSDCRHLPSTASRNEDVSGQWAEWEVWDTLVCTDTFVRCLGPF
jgi:hypothetical protein